MMKSNKHSSVFQVALICCKCVPNSLHERHLLLLVGYKSILCILSRRKYIVGPSTNAFFFIFRREICCWSGTNPFIAFSAEEKYIIGPRTNPFIVFSGEKYIVGRVQMVWLFPSLISERGTHCCG